MESINQPQLATDFFKGFWIRTVAAILDGFIILFFWMFTFFLVFTVGNTGLLSDSDVILSFIILVLTLAIVGIIYKPIMETSDYQGTFGKYFLGMKIVNQNGQKIDLRTSLIRTLVYFSQTLIPWLNLLTVWLLLLIGFTDHKQGLHDIAAKTYVVSKHWQGPISVEDNFGA